MMPACATAVAMMKDCSQNTKRILQMALRSLENTARERGGLREIEGMSAYFAVKSANEAVFPM